MVSVLMVDPVFDNTVNDLSLNCQRHVEVPKINLSGRCPLEILPFHEENAIDPDLVGESIDP